MSFSRSVKPRNAAHKRAAVTSTRDYFVSVMTCSLATASNSSIFVRIE